MAEPNPYRTRARVFAFASYLCAVLLSLFGLLYAIAVAQADLTKLPLGGISNRAAAFLSAAPFVVVAVLIALLGWLVQSLFGQPRVRDKLAARSAVGCLQLGSLGCGLWTALSVATMLLTNNLVGRMLGTEAQGGLGGVMAVLAGFILIAGILLAVARFISVTFLDMKPQRALQSYLDEVRRKMHRMHDPQVREDVHDETLKILPRLRASQKGSLLGFLSEAGLLTGHLRIMLENTDFRRADLRSVSLPHADLRQVNLEQALLQGAILYKVNLQKARLNDADLSGANLQGAILRQAVLTGAVLERTNLSDADLTGAIMANSQLDRARLKDTTLPDGTVRH